MTKEEKHGLEYYGGSGFEGVEEDGKFKVEVESGKKEFTKLSEARKYYDELMEEKVIWDITVIPELLCCYVENNPDIK